MLIIAKELKVEMFCIGTEFSMSTSQRPDFGISLSKKLKQNTMENSPILPIGIILKKYLFGKNWTISGVSAYFSIAEGKTPKTDDLIKGCKSHFNKLKSVSDSIKKPV